MKKQIFINNNTSHYRCVTLYNPDHPDLPTIKHFQCFYEATQFINKNDYSIVYLKDKIKDGGMLWGVRRWT